jgi:hypothetical protein
LLCNTLFFPENHIALLVFCLGCIQHWFKALLLALQKIKVSQEQKKFCIRSGSPEALLLALQKIAEFLAAHLRVKQVNYIGLPDHPGQALHYSQVYLLFSMMSCMVAWVA